MIGIQWKECLQRKMPEYRELLGAGEVPTEQARCALQDDRRIQHHL